MDLGGNRLGDPGAVAFAAALRVKHAALTDLHLDYNGIGDAGGHALAQALAGGGGSGGGDGENVSLTNLWLHGNAAIGQHSHVGINAALRRNRLRVSRTCSQALSKAFVNGIHWPFPMFTLQFYQFSWNDLNVDRNYQYLPMFMLRA
eukprot:COSAG05_NODE_6885_length_887_cov_1.437817_2_plen_146_part_01